MKNVHNFTDKLKAEWQYLAAVTLWPLVLFFTNLGRGAIGGNDEIIYSGVAQKIVSTNDWLTMHYTAGTWFDKPPLLMWLTASSYVAFGTSTFTSRLVSASAGVLMCLVTYMIGRKLFSKQAGLIAALVLVTNQFVLAYGRQGMTDTLLTLFGLLAVYAYLLVERDKRWWLAVWASLALAVMTKGAAAFPIVLVLVCIVMVHGKLAFLKEKYFWYGAGLFLLITVPWHAAMVLLHKDFISQYLGYHVLKRAEVPIEGHVGGSRHYLGIVRHLFYPWAVYGLAALVAAAVSFYKKQKVFSYLVPIIGFVVVFGFYTLVKTKLDWYVVPSLPYLALLIGALFAEAAKKLKSYQYALVWLATFILAYQQNTKPQILFILILGMAIIFRKNKRMPQYSTYALFGWAFLMAILSIRAIY